MVSVTLLPLITPRKDPVPNVQEAGWAPGPVWTGAENLATTGIRSPDRPARSQSLYRLRYPAHSLFRPHRKLIKNSVKLKSVVRKAISASHVSISRGPLGFAVDLLITDVIYMFLCFYHLHVTYCNQFQETMKIKRYSERKCRSVLNPH